MRNPEDFRMLQPRRDPNMRLFSGGILAAWVVILLLNVAIIGVAIWAVITLVNYLTA